MTTNPPLDWSELIPDVLSLIYNRLSFADFARAKTVCSSWYSASRSSSPRKNHIPWLIFRRDRNWKLFNPEEGKFYRTQINRLGFADCRSLATCGNWVLVRDEYVNLNIFNPFTLKIIPLPPLQYELFDNRPFYFDCNSDQSHPVRVENVVLWVDERTKDYLVAWTSRDSDQLRFCKKGDEKWLETPTCKALRGHDNGGVDSMVYKDKKLYIFSVYGRIYILDFSQDFPREVLNHPYVNLQFWKGRYTTRMKLTASGNVVLMVQDSYPSKRFEVYKMNNTNEEWEEVTSLDEEEALVSDLSDTLPTKGVSGIKKNSIYFCDFYPSFMPEEASTYEIPTQRIERFEHCSHLRDARWFLPCFGVGE